MADFETITGAAYVVTAKTDTTITDANGLELEVPGGEQRTFFATTESVAIEGSCTITQARGNFSLPIGLGIGGPYLPKPESLPDDGELKNGHVYLVHATSGLLDLSGYLPLPNSTVEVWVDYDGGTVKLPEGLSWVDNDEPTTWEAGARYCIVMRHDGVSILANCCYNYTRPTPAS